MALRNSGAIQPGKTPNCHRARDPMYQLRLGWTLLLNYYRSRGCCTKPLHSHPPWHDLTWHLEENIRSLAHQVWTDPMWTHLQGEWKDYKLNRAQCESDPFTTWKRHSSSTHDRVIVSASILSPPLHMQLPVDFFHKVIRSCRIYYNRKVDEKGTIMMASLEREL